MSEAKLWDILGKYYGIYYGIYLSRAMQYICKTMGFIQKDYGIYKAEIMVYIGLRL